MRHVKLDHSHALSAKIMWREGMRALLVYTKLDLAEDADGKLSPELQSLVDCAFEARDLYYPSIKRVEVVKVSPDRTAI